VPILVGIDLVSCETILDSVNTHGDRYLERVYTGQEIEDSTTRAGVSSKRLAARFAAKEATMKALRLPAGAAVPWREIEIRRAPDRFELTLDGRAATLADRAGLDALSLSITYEQGLALAVVIARFAVGD
jgi:holo-[acyl-carrier protein] synthase